MKKCKLMFLWSILLIAVMALTCGFFFACADDEETLKEEFDPYALVGTWSNPDIVAYTTFIVSEATAAVELTVNEDGTLSLRIEDIRVEFNGSIISDFRTIEINMTGTWEAKDGDYAMGLDNNSAVTYEEGGELKIAPVRESGVVIGVTLSFSLSYHIEIFGNYDIPLSMTDAMLYAGPLETA